jgi:hypothetical protein
MAFLRLTKPLRIIQERHRQSLTNCVRAPLIFHHIFVKTCHHTTLTEFEISPKMRGEVPKYLKRLDMLYYFDGNLELVIVGLSIPPVRRHVEKLFQ